MIDAFLPDTVERCADAETIARWLIESHPAGKFSFASQARIAYLLHQPELTHQGVPADGLITRATVQGSNRLLFAFLAAVHFEPGLAPLDFLIYLDAAQWQSRGTRNTERGRSGFPILQEALIFHELCHLRHSHTKDGEPRFTEDGRPLLAIGPHDRERFDDEIKEYGPSTLEIEDFGTVFVEGARAEKERRKLRRAG